MRTILGLLARGSRARAAERLTDEFAVALIDQKVCEAEAGLRAAKDALASLIVRLRRERASLAGLRERKADLERRALSALDGGDEELAARAAGMIAEMEGEESLRTDTVSRLDRRTAQLRLSIERAHRRVVDLRQGAMTARAVERERAAQRRIGAAFREADPEAEALIARVMEADDPFETAEARREIDAELNGETVVAELGRRGHGAPLRPSGADVLARLRAARENA